MNLTLCSREDTITQLIEILDSEFVAHVRGTLVSGKTTMAMLLVERLEKEGRKVVFIRTWLWDQYGDHYRAALVDEATKQNLDLDPSKLNSYLNAVFIIDNAQ
jgi:predicted AAA+ superfamily ATPase